MSLPVSTMAKFEAVYTDKAPKPLPQFSQAVKHNGMVYCSGNIAIDPDTGLKVEGTVKDRAVGLLISILRTNTGL